VEFEDSKEEQLLRLWLIASLYTRVEQLSEITGDLEIDTEDLDEVFLINQDVRNETIAEQWLKIFRINMHPDKKNPPKQTFKTAETLILDSLFLPEQKKQFKFLVDKILVLEDEKELKDFMTLFQEYLEMQDYLLLWMAESRRHDIADKITKEKNNREGEL